MDYSAIPKDFGIPDGYRPKCHTTNTKLHTESGDIIEGSVKKIINEIKELQPGDYIEVEDEAGERTYGIYQVVELNGNMCFINLACYPDDYGTINPIGNIVNCNPGWDKAYWHNEHSPLKVGDFLNRFEFSGYNITVSTAYKHKKEFIVYAKFYDTLACQEVEFHIGQTNSDENLTIGNIISRFEKSLENLEKIKNFYLYVTYGEKCGETYEIEDANLDFAHCISQHINLLSHVSVDTSDLNKISQKTIIAYY